MFSLPQTFLRSSSPPHPQNSMSFPHLLKKKQRNKQKNKKLIHTKHIHREKSKYASKRPKTQKKIQRKQFEKKCLKHTKYH